MRARFIRLTWVSTASASCPLPYTWREVLWDGSCLASSLGPPGARHYKSEIMTNSPLRRGCGEPLCRPEAKSPRATNRRAPPQSSVTLSILPRQRAGLGPLLQAKGLARPLRAAQSLNPCWVLLI